MSWLSLRFGLQRGIARSIVLPFGVAAFSTISNAVLLAKDLRHYRAELAQGEVAATATFVRRAESLRPFLPARGAVGYFTPDQGREVLVQLAVAPIRLDRDIRHGLVLVDFSTTPPDEGELRARGLTLVADVGDGLGLYRGAPD